MPHLLSVPPEFQLFPVSAFHARCARCGLWNQVITLPLLALPAPQLTSTLHKAPSTSIIDFTSNARSAEYVEQYAGQKRCTLHSERLIGISPTTIILQLNHPRSFCIQLTKTGPWTIPVHLPTSRAGRRRAFPTLVDGVSSNGDLQCSGYAVLIVSSSLDN